MRWLELEKYALHSPCSVESQGSKRNRLPWLKQKGNIKKSWTVLELILLVKLSIRIRKSTTRLKQGPWMHPLSIINVINTEDDRLHSLIDELFKALLFVPVISFNLFNKICGVYTVSCQQCNLHRSQEAFSFSLFPRLHFSFSWSAQGFHPGR